MLHPALAVVAIGSVVPLLWQLAYPAMFSRYLDYDDEGYLLVSLAGYMDGHALYDQVFTQYGPFHYQLLSAIFRTAGFVPSHDDGRLVTLALWLIASSGVGLAAYLYSRSVLLAVGAQCIAFMVLFTVTFEPLHPGAVLSGLLILLVAVVTLVERMPRAAWFLAGLVAAAMTLVKINIGGLALIGLVAIGIASSDAASWVRRTAAAVPALVPFLLMGRDLGEPGVTAYAAIVSVAAAAVCAVGLRAVAIGPWRPAILWLLGGAASAAGVIITAALIQGSSVEGLLTGVVLRPLGQSEAFTVRLGLPTQAVVWALCVAAAGVAFGIPRLRARIPLPPMALAVTRLLAGLAMWVAVGGVFGPTVPAFALGIPLAWVVLLEDRDSKRGVAVFVLALLAVLQSLHAYPVAGSQTSWSGLLLVPLGAVAIADGIRRLVGELRGGRRIAATVAGFIPVLVLLAWLARVPMMSLYTTVRAGYLGWSSPGLAGAERLRLDRRSSTTYTRVTAVLREECRTFYSWPGMNSFYFWTGQDPPSMLNATAWPALFDDALQQRVVNDLRRTDGVCLLRNRVLADTWLQGRPSPRGPLTEYLDASFELRASVRDYEILARRE